MDSLAILAHTKITTASQQQLPTWEFQKGKEMSTVQGKDNSNNWDNFLRVYSMPGILVQAAFHLTLQAKVVGILRKNDSGEGKREILHKHFLFLPISVKGGHREKTIT